MVIVAMDGKKKPIMEELPWIFPVNSLPGLSQRMQLFMTLKKMQKRWVHR